MVIGPVPFRLKDGRKAVLRSLAAKGREHVTQLELTFIEGNSRALYEKMGFRVVGVHPDAIRLADGAFKSEYLMSRKMDRSSAD